MDPKNPSVVRKTYIRGQTMGEIGKVNALYGWFLVNIAGDFGAGGRFCSY